MWCTFSMLQLRIIRLLLEESDKGFIQIAQDLLQQLGVAVLQPS
jgi:hypothetical protein